MIAPVTRVRRIRTPELSDAEIAAIRSILWAAFADEGPHEQFTEHDWEHGLGGIHVVLDVDGEIASHAALVTRELQVAGRPLRTGYVEAVATAPSLQRLGHGSAVMRDVA